MQQRGVLIGRPAIMRYLGERWANFPELRDQGLPVYKLRPGPREPWRLNRSDADDWLEQQRVRTAV